MRWLRQGKSPDSDTSQLASVRIFTHEVELTGLLATTGQRVTDLLLRGNDLVFLPAGADAAPDNWLTISPPHVLLVIPPPLPSRPEWRGTVEQRRLFVSIGHFRVTGTAHLSPGTAINEDLRSTQPFLPLTEASLSPSDGNEGDAGEPLEVVIVNLEASAAFGPLE